MFRGDEDPESLAVPVRTREYTAGASSRHSSASARRRLLFFGLAAVWGFLTGATGLLAAMSVAGQPVQPGLRVISGLVPALLVAIGGGCVMAAAYRESKRRSRG